MSDSLRPHGLHSPWNSPGQNTGVGSLFLLQGIFPTQGLNPGLLHCRQILYQLSHMGSPRILEWVAYPFSRVSSWPRNWTRVSCIAGRFSTNWAIREAFFPMGINQFWICLCIHVSIPDGCNIILVPSFINKLNKFLIYFNFMFVWESWFCFLFFDQNGIFTFTTV